MRTAQQSSVNYQSRQRPVSSTPRAASAPAPKQKDTDIRWITPIRLGCLFVVALIVTIYFNGV